MRVVYPGRIEMLECCFCEGRKTGEPKEKTGASRKPTKNSSRIWQQARNFLRAYSLNCTPLYPIYMRNFHDFVNAKTLFVKISIKVNLNLFNRRLVTSGRTHCGLTLMCRCYQTVSMASSNSSRDFLARSKLYHFVTSWKRKWRNLRILYHSSLIWRTRL